MFAEIGFQNALLSRDTASSACSKVTLGNSAVMRREEKSGSKMTLKPANFPMVSKMIFASLVIVKLMGSREIGFNCGGPASTSLSSGEAAGCGALAAASFRQQLHHVLHLLLRRGVRWIHGLRLLIFRQRHLHIAAVESLLALVHVELRIHELQMRDFDFVFEILRIGAQRPLVLHQRRVVILNCLGLLSGMEVGVALGAPGEKH